MSEKATLEYSSSGDPTYTSSTSGSSKYTPHSKHSEYPSSLSEDSNTILKSPSKMSDSDSVKNDSSNYYSFFGVSAYRRKVNTDENASASKFSSRDSFFSDSSLTYTQHNMSHLRSGRGIEAHESTTSLLSNYSADISYNEDISDDNSNDDSENDGNDDNDNNNDNNEDTSNLPTSLSQLSLTLTPRPSSFPFSYRSHVVFFKEPTRSRTNPFPYVLQTQIDKQVELTERLRDYSAKVSSGNTSFKNLWEEITQIRKERDALYNEVKYLCFAELVGEIHPPGFISSTSETASVKWYCDDGCWSLGGVVDRETRRLKELEAEMMEIGILPLELQSGGKENDSEEGKKKRTRKHKRKKGKKATEEITDSERGEESGIDNDEETESGVYMRAGGDLNTKTKDKAEKW